MIRFNSMYFARKCILAFVSNEPTEPAQFIPPKVSPLFMKHETAGSRLIVGIPCRVSGTEYLSLNVY